MGEEVNINEVLGEIRDVLNTLKEKDKNVSNWIIPTLRTVIGSIIVMFIVGVVAFAKVPYDNRQDIEKNREHCVNNNVELRKELNIRLEDINENFKMFHQELPIGTYFKEIKQIKDYE